MAVQAVSESSSPETGDAGGVPNPAEPQLVVPAAVVNESMVKLGPAVVVVVEVVGVVVVVGAAVVVVVAGDVVVVTGAPVVVVVGAVVVDVVAGAVVVVVAPTVVVVVAGGGQVPAAHDPGPTSMPEHWPAAVMVHVSKAPPTDD